MTHSSLPRELRVTRGPAPDVVHTLDAGPLRGFLRGYVRSLYEAESSPPPRKPCFLFVLLTSEKREEKVQVWEKNKSSATLVHPDGNPSQCLPGGGGGGWGAGPGGRGPLPGATLDQERPSTAVLGARKHWLLSPSAALWPAALGYQLLSAALSCSIWRMAHSHLTELAGEQDLAQRQGASQHC